MEQYRELFAEMLIAYPYIPVISLILACVSGLTLASVTDNRDVGHFFGMCTVVGSVMTNLDNLLDPATKAGSIGCMLTMLFVGIISRFIVEIGFRIRFIVTKALTNKKNRIK